MDCRVKPGNDGGGRGSKRAGGAGRGRARCGGACQRHGNLLERADLRAQMLNQDPRPSPACFCNASRWNEETFCTAWNVVTHATDLNSRSCFVLGRVGARVKGHLWEVFRKIGSPIFTIWYMFGA